MASANNRKKNKSNSNSKTKSKKKIEKKSLQNLNHIGKDLTMLKQLSQDKEIRDFDRKYGVVSNGNGNNKKERVKSLPVFLAYKYSKPNLHEAVIINNFPYFIKHDYDSNKIVTVESIKESSRVLRPPNGEGEYSYIPYEFVDAGELNEYYDRAKNGSKDSLLKKAKSIVRKYNDQDEYKQNLLAIDIIWSYFQDCFSTTHYIGITGENDSGKTSVGNTFEAIGYRPVNMTAPSASNIFRTLGVIEPGQCTLILDEAEGISDNFDIMNILKTGYDFDKKVPKTNTNSWQVEWFFTYCLKIIIAEKSPSKFKAKGLLDRTFLFSVFAGDVEYDIKEVQNPKGNPKLEEALAELLDFRKLLLIYRLIHYEGSYH